MRAGEKPILFYCEDCQGEHYASFLGGPTQLSQSTALVKQKLCIGCGNPTTGSIGRAGYYWPNVCQQCKNEADEFLDHQIEIECSSLGRMLEV